MDLATLQYKIANKLHLTPSEEAFIMKTTDDKGVPSRRKFTGIAEYPKSEIDFTD